MASEPGNVGGDQINMTGTFHGAVYIKATIHGAVSSVTAIGGLAPSQQDDIKAALERLGALLQTLPEDKVALGRKVADSAKDLVEAAKPGNDRSLFEGYADTLKTWAEKVGTTVPAITVAAQAVETLVAQARGWL